ncbi:SPOR domain-containing protein [Novosphingobium sp.]|uniref:SPOR domain-containing protein n=1 Tax=Novosphingobium sp. TaxID=1874826 RepID=UPI0025F51682|nr:SPOR domain-containing protein [Novosphingobium sp.]
MSIVASALAGAMLTATPVAAQSGTGYAASVQQGVDAASRNDYPAAVKLWQGPAAAGDADAQYNLGIAYKNGLGVTADMTRAEELFRKAATQGHVDAGDQYGLLLFQTGRRREALPWLEAAAEHGEERAQYVLGTAHYNGDFVPKDWITAYALMSSASGQGLLQAKSSLAMMDQTIPLEQRQQGIAMAQDMQKKALSLHGSQLAAADLGAPRVAPSGPRITPAPVPPSMAAGDDTPYAPPPRPTAAAAGASYASAPVPEPRVRPPAPKPATMPKPAVVMAPKPAQVAAAKPAESGTGRWRVQLGAFGQAANANALWSRAGARAELAGKRRIDVAGGSVTRLQAGGFASETAANQACAGLKAAGFVCVVVKP